MPPEHVLLCYLGFGQSDEVLRQAVELCSISGARLSVLLPAVDAVFPDGCCGVQGDQWRRMMDEETQAAAAHAAQLLTTLRCPPAHVTAGAGRSISEVVVSAATRLGCDAIAVGRKRRPWSGGLSRRQIHALRRTAQGTVIELAAAPGESRLAPKSSPEAGSGRVRSVSERHGV